MADLHDKIERLSDKWKRRKDAIRSDECLPGEIRRARVHVYDRVIADIDTLLMQTKEEEDT